MTRITKTNALALAAMPGIGRWLKRQVLARSLRQLHFHLRTDTGVIELSDGLLVKLDLDRS